MSFPALGPGDAAGCPVRIPFLPDNLFYNTTAAGIIVVLNRAKPAERRGKVVLVNASAEFEKGRPKNFIPDDAITKIADAFQTGNDVERLVKVASAADIASNDYNLSPSRYVETATATEHRDIQTILDELATLETEAARLDGALRGIFTGLGYQLLGVIRGNVEDHCHVRLGASRLHGEWFVPSAAVVEFIRENAVTPESHRL